MYFTVLKLHGVVGDYCRLQTDISVLDVLRPVNREGSYQAGPKTKYIATTNHILIHWLVTTSDIPVFMRGTVSGGEGG